MKACEICGAEITPKARVYNRILTAKEAMEHASTHNIETSPCPRCGRMRCERCDMGKNTVCVDCDSE